MSVIRLPLVVDEQAAARLGKLFTGMFCVKRALQRDVRARVAAFWTGTHRREQDAAGWRRQLGLTRQGLERTAYAHLDSSGWLRHHATKALVMHQADEVWAGVERHLFPDSTGHRAGRPRTGSWREYTRIAGRARSHTKSRKWETFRLHGSLQGHLNAYRHPDLPAEAATPAHAATLDAGVSVLNQPHHSPSLRHGWCETRGVVGLQRPADGGVRRRPRQRAR